MENILILTIPYFADFAHRSGRLEKEKKSRNLSRQICDDAGTVAKLKERQYSGMNTT